MLQGSSEQPSSGTASLRVSLDSMGWTRNLKRQFEFDFEDLRLSGPPIDGIPNFPPN